MFDIDNELVFKFINNESHNFVWCSKLYREERRWLKEEKKLRKLRKLRKKRKLKEERKEDNILVSFYFRKKRSSLLEGRFFYEAVDELSSSFFPKDLFNFILPSSSDIFKTIDTSPSNLSYAFSNNWRSL